MENTKVVFTEPWQVDVQHDGIADLRLEGKQALVRKLYTLISAGTELACLSGLESWFLMPGVPGYSAVSEIVEVGPEANGFQVGDRIYHHGNHAKYEVVETDGFCLKVPNGLESRWVPYTRLATVAITAIRASQIEVGDYVGVSGMGLVGNMASQLAKLQGGNVIGLDLSESRLHTARQCGMNHAIRIGQGSVKEEIMTITQGEGVSTMIEATGVPKVAEDALDWVKRSGELILLGSPRGDYESNLTSVLNHCHLYQGGNLTLKGAHEWRYPVMPNEFVKHSIYRNSKVVFSLMEQNRLQIEPLISHVVKPEGAPKAYEGLRFRKDDYYGVLIDWQ